MSLHVQVTRKGNQLLVMGQWESRLPLFDTFTVPVFPGETAAETVELAMMEMNLAPSWTWSKRTDAPVLQGEFTYSSEGFPAHKEVTDSGAKNYDLKEN